VTQSADEALAAEIAARRARAHEDEPPAPPRRSNGAAQQREPRAEHERPAIPVRSALVIAAHPQRNNWLLRPYLERAATVLMVGAEGTYKSFLALHWALTVAGEGEQVVYLHAEGRGLWKRLRAWCKHNYPTVPWTKFYNNTPFHAVECPLNLSDSATVDAFAAACCNLHKPEPALIVVDTITRNSDGMLESSNSDAMKYLNLIDQRLRARFCFCTTSGTRRATAPADPSHSSLPRMRITCSNAPTLKSAKSSSKRAV
jgi:hypothetical protein